MPYDVKTLPLFPTMLRVAMLPDIDNASLVSIIYQLERAGYVQQGPGLGAVQTTGNFLMVDHPSVKKLVGVFCEFVRLSGGMLDPIFHVSGWANIGRPNDPTMDTWHNHVPWNWSAVYYPQVPKLPTNGPGQIRFADPRGNLERLPDAGFTPMTGMMIVFPSWLEHTVIPFNGEGDRISISLNALLGMPANTMHTLPPHQIRRVPRGQVVAQERDPAAPAIFPYGAEQRTIQLTKLPKQIMANPTAAAPQPVTTEAKE